MVLVAQFVSYVNNKMTSVVEITFVDESLNFDFKIVENTCRATMGMRFKNNFTAWREV